jgi:hypothetical protein
MAWTTYIASYCIITTKAGAHFRKWKWNPTYCLSKCDILGEVSGCLPSPFKPLQGTYKKMLLHNKLYDNLIKLNYPEFYETLKLITGANTYSNGI